jgi:hypothetical protein
MIQASTTATKRQNDVFVKDINVVYPPQFQDKVKMEHNSYHGRGIKSKFSFSLPST